MKKAMIALAVVACLAFASCTTTLPVGGATGKVGSKVGEATANWILYPMLLSGDAGVVAAAKAGGISTVGTIDMRSNWMLVLGSITTVVTGE